MPVGREFQVASGCLATSSILRPLFTDSGRCSRMSPLRRASSSSALMTQPVFLSVGWFAVHPNQMPAAAEFLTVEVELQMALLVALMRIAIRRPGTPIPDKHRAATILPLGDDAFEVAIVQRVILDVNGKPLFIRIEAWPACDCPAFQRAIELRPEVSSAVSSHRVSE